MHPNRTPSIAMTRFTLRLGGLMICSFKARDTSDLQADYVLTKERLAIYTYNIMYVLHLRFISLDAGTR